MRLVLLLLALAAACTAAPTPVPTPTPSYAGSPGTSEEHLEPLQGKNLTGPTGLRLLIGGTVLDVDRGTRSRVGGLPDVPDDEVVIDALGRDVVLTVSMPRQEVYVLRDNASTAKRIASGVHVTPGTDGLWAMTYGDTCSLAKLDLDGQVLLPAKPIDCAAQPPPATEEGRWDGDQTLVLGARRFTIPKSISYGPPSVTTSPDRRYLALEYGHPAWPGPRQRMDVWVLDLRTAKWTHLPSMPVAAALKLTDLTWTGDGRLVLLGEFEGTGTALATWRPGDQQLAIRQMDVASSQLIAL